MIKLLLFFANKKTEIVLPPKTILSFSDTHPAFATNKRTGAFSYSFDTLETKELATFLSSWHNQNTTKNKTTLKAVLQLFGHSMHVTARISKKEIKIDQSTPIFKIQLIYGTATEEENLSKNIRTILERNWTNKNQATQTWTEYLNTENEAHLVFAPAFMPNFFEEKKTNFTGWLNPVEYTEYSPVLGGGEYRFQVKDITTLLTDTSPEDSTCPSFKLTLIIKYIAEKLGWSVHSPDFLEQVHIKKIAIWVNKSSYANEQPFKLGPYLPNWTVKTLLDNVATHFGCYWHVENKTLRFHSKKHLFAASKTIDLTQYLSEGYSLLQEKKMTKTFLYPEIDLDPQILTTDEVSFNSLNTENDLPDTAEEYTIVFIEASQRYFQFKNGTWEKKAPTFPSAFPATDATSKKKLGFRAASMELFFDETENNYYPILIGDLTSKNHFLGLSGKEDYRLFFDHGKIQGRIWTTPANVDINGNKLAPHSLQFEGNNGIHAYYIAPVEEWEQNTEKIEIKTKLPISIVLDLVKHKHTTARILNKTFIITNIAYKTSSASPLVDCTIEGLNTAIFATTVTSPYTAVASCNYVPDLDISLDFLTIVAKPQSPKMLFQDTRFYSKNGGTSWIPYSGDRLPDAATGEGCAFDCKEEISNGQVTGWEITKTFQHNIVYGFIDPNVNGEFTNFQTGAIIPKATTGEALFVFIPNSLPFLDENAKGFRWIDWSNRQHIMGTPNSMNGNIIENENLRIKRICKKTEECPAVQVEYIIKLDCSDVYKATIDQLKV